MNRGLNIALWVLFFGLMAPSGMALASWNAVPGDSTYGMKIALEKALLLVLSPSNQLQSTTNLKLTERRMGEVSRVLSGSHAKESLDNLTMQIAQTRESLVGIGDDQAKRAAIENYILTLQTVQAQLEKEKVDRALAYLPPPQAGSRSYRLSGVRPTTQVPIQTVTSPNQPTQTSVTYTTTNYYYPAPAQPTTNNYQQPTQNYVPQPVGSTETDADTVPSAGSSSGSDETIPPEIVDEITETQDEIEEVIEELEEIADETSSGQDETPPASEPTEEPTSEPDPGPGQSDEHGGGPGENPGQGGGQDKNPEPSPE